MDQSFIVVRRPDRTPPSRAPETQNESDSATLKTSQPCRSTAAHAHVGSASSSSNATDRCARGFEGKGASGANANHLSKQLRWQRWPQQGRATAGSVSRTPQTTQAPFCCSPKNQIESGRAARRQTRRPTRRSRPAMLNAYKSAVWGGPALLDLRGETTSDLIFRSALRRAGSTRRQTRTVSSKAAVARASPRAENATALTMDAWPLSLPAGAPPRQSCTPLPAADANKGSASRV